MNIRNRILLQFIVTLNPALRISSYVNKNLKARLLKRADVEENAQIVRLRIRNN